MKLPNPKNLFTLRSERTEQVADTHATVKRDMTERSIDFVNMTTVFIVTVKEEQAKKEEQMKHPLSDQQTALQPRIDSWHDDVGSAEIRDLGSLLEAAGAGVAVGALVMAEILHQPELVRIGAGSLGVVAVGAVVKTLGRD